MLISFQRVKSIDDSDLRWNRLSKLSIKGDINDEHEGTLVRAIRRIDNLFNEHWYGFDKAEIWNITHCSSGLTWPISSITRNTEPVESSLIPK